MPACAVASGPASSQQPSRRPPSSTGGGLIHYCGAQAKTFCRYSFANFDSISLAARTQCDLAGLTEAKLSAG